MPTLVYQVFFLCVYKQCMKLSKPSLFSCSVQYQIILIVTDLSVSAFMC